MDDLKIHNFDGLEKTNWQLTYNLKGGVKKVWKNIDGSNLGRIPDYNLEPPEPEVEPCETCEYNWCGECHLGKDPSPLLGGCEDWVEAVFEVES